MLGTNPKRKPITKYVGTLQLKEIVPTFQGEGVYTGHPAVFVRLGGCNLACKFCDTYFEDFNEVSVENIVKDIETKSTSEGAKKKLVVITGGEPLRQPIEELCTKLLERDYTVQIETNGTFYRDLDSRIKIVCSPKVINRKYTKVDTRLTKQISALKFLISANFEGYEDVPDTYLQYADIPIYLQPMDERDEQKNKQNMLLTIKLANKYGCRISLQTHKIWGIY